jgi:hypothetical protein
MCNEWDVVSLLKVFIIVRQHTAVGFYGAK